MLVFPAIAFAASLLLFWISLRVFPYLGLLDFPERYGLKRTRLPYPTGIVAVLAFLFLLPFLTVIDAKETGLIGAVLLIAFVSFWDDRTPLPSWLRLLTQIAAAFTLFATGSRIYTITNPAGGILKLDSILIHTNFAGALPVLSGIFTILWLLLTINALNWFDGIPGQVSVLSTIGFLMLGFLAYFRNGETDIALLAFTLAAIALAAACFDVPPAKMLLGDTGSMFFGLMLGLLAVYHGGKVATAFLALGIPLTDAVLVTIKRIAKGHSPLTGGRDHLHHLLLDRGWSPRQVIVLTAILGTAFGATALFMSTAEKGIAGGILVIIVIALTLYAPRKGN
jgi:UDP-GlcNAc:undecaprenyl-phosphate GlcNAc-1-phosphate transferase